MIIKLVAQLIAILYKCMQGKFFDVRISQIACDQLMSLTIPQILKTNNTLYGNLPLHCANN